MPISRVLAVTFDCHDPALLAAFWRELVGGEVDTRTESDDWVALRDVPVIGNIGFQKVPEAKAVKNRVHLDVEVDDIGVAIPHVIALGAADSGGAPTTTVAGATTVPGETTTTVAGATTTTVAGETTTTVVTTTSEG